MMLEKFSGRIYSAYQENPSVFRMRIFFLVLLWGVIAGLGVSALYFVAMGLSFQENLALFLVPLGIFIVFSLLVFFLFIKLLFRRKSAGVLENLDVPGRLRVHLLSSLGKMNFRDFEEAVLREFEEQRISFEEEQHRRLAVAARFGMYVPEAQLEKILEDEHFFALLGMERDALAVGISLTGLSGALPELEGEERTELLRKIHSEYRSFAKQQDLLFHNFHSAGSFFYHGLPYDSETIPLGKLVKRLEKLCIKLSSLFSGSDIEVSPLCLVARGTLKAGLVESDTGSTYVVDGGPVMVIHHAFRRLSGQSGVFIHGSAEDREEDAGWRSSEERV